jgi:hypothetical protein
MKLIKKFEEFVYGGPATQPSPSKSPSTTPTIAPTKPSPSTRPGKPSPIRRDKPAVEPAPKAKKEMKTAEVEDVIKKFAKLTNQNY